VAKIKRATSFLNKRSSTQFHHDCKPMQSIIDILHKNFQEDHTNSRRFPGWFLNSRFSGVVDILDMLQVDVMYNIQFFECQNGSNCVNFCKIYTLMKTGVLARPCCENPTMSVVSMQQRHVADKHPHFGGFQCNSGMWRTNTPILGVSFFIIFMLL